MKQLLILAFGFVFAIFGLAIVPSVSIAAPDPAPTPVPVAHVDLSSMMFLTGVWTCTQEVRGKQRPDTSTTTTGLDGTWLITDDSAPPFDRYRNFTVKSLSYLTYDASVKRWVTISVDSTGGYFMSSSPGWVGNTMNWSGKGLDGSTGTDVFSKMSDTETVDNGTSTDSAGKVTKQPPVFCKKTSS